MSHVRHLVLDEADRMVEDGHFQELTYILQHLYDALKNRHGIPCNTFFPLILRRVFVDRLQTFIFSATLSVGVNELFVIKDPCF
jgi:superfamily II DNA/RNA helicase